jgi:excisionase family DNA binding protein
MAANRRTMGELLKLPEVAERLGVSEKTVRRYVKAGVLPSVFIGNSYRITEVDIEEFLRISRVGPGGKRPKVKRRSSDVEPSFNDVLNEEERREQEREEALVKAYLEERRRSSRQLHASRAHVDRVARRWENAGQEPTIEEVRSTLRDLEGQVEAGVFEQRSPLDPALQPLINTAALDEADRFEVEMLHKAVERLRAVAENVVSEEDAERLRNTWAVIEGFREAS